MFSNYKKIDLTHTLHSGIPTWDLSCGYTAKITIDHKDCTTAVKYRNHFLSMPAGVGTHIDAPLHCDPNGIDIADIPIEELSVPAVVINVSAKIKTNPDYLISVQDIYDFEEKHGAIPEGALVIGYTGWDQFWSEPKKYRNEDEHGVMRYPSVSLEAAKYLIKIRKIVGLGIDTLSPDTINSGFPVHDFVLRVSGKYIVENIANAGLLPPVGAYVVVSPLKLEGGTESPIRLIAFVPKT